MLDLLLVNPNNRIVSPYAGVEPPLWAGLVASHYKEQGQRISILDAEAGDLTIEQTVEAIKNVDPRMVLIVIMGNNPSASSTPKMLVTKRLIERLNGYKVAVTGLHPSALPYETEMELGVPVLKGKIFEGMPNVPWELLPMEKYIAHNWHCLDGSPRSPYASVYTSLGCPFNCVAAGTSVRTANSARNIEYIYNTNTKILGWANKTIKETNILYGIEKIVDELIEITLPDGRILLVTPEHLIFTKRGWIKANSLTIEDEVLTLNTYDAKKELKHCLTCGKLKLMKKDSTYCSVSCMAKAQSHDYAKGANNVSKRPEVRDKIRQSKLGDKNPMKRPEVVAKVSASLKANHSQENADRMREAWASGKITSHSMTIEAKNRQSERMKKNNPMFNTELAKNNGKRHSYRYQNDTEYRNRMLESRTRHPNKMEQQLTEIIQKHNLPFRFTGNFSYWIGKCKSGKSRNPDYVDTEHKKKVILAHGNYHHSNSILTQVEVDDYITYGYQVLLIWEDEINQLNESRLVKKIEAYYES